MYFFQLLVGGVDGKRSLLEEVLTEVLLWQVIAAFDWTDFAL